MLCRRLYACCKPSPEDLDLDSSHSSNPSPSDEQDDSYDDGCFARGTESRPTNQQLHQRPVRMRITTKKSLEGEGLGERQSISDNIDPGSICTPATECTGVISPVIEKSSTNCVTEKQVRGHIDDPWMPIYLLPPVLHFPVARSPLYSSRLLLC